MNLQSPSSSFHLSRIIPPSHPCPCGNFAGISAPNARARRSKRPISNSSHQNSRNRLGLLACSIHSDASTQKISVDFVQSATRGAKNFVAKGFSSEFADGEELSQEQSISNFTNFQEDPIVDKLRTQLGVIHPIPAPPINRKIAGLFVLFFFVGVIFDKIWTARKRWNKMGSEDAFKKGGGAWPQVPTSFSLFLEKDLQRKESVEWVNMVLGKLWMVYREGIENWIIGLLQPVIDDLKKPDYVQRVEIKQFSLGDEPLSVRNVERRTSRRVNDLQYQIGLRYTGGARMLLMLSLKFGIIPVMVPVGVRDFDIDGELWVKLRLIQTEPWVGAVQWAFVSLPKIKFELSPFRLFNLMAIPVLSQFLTKLLTEDLPRLFVRPKKIVLDFQKGKAVSPVSNDFVSGEIQKEKNKDFVGELSVTLVDARKLSYIFSGKTDPYVVLSIGDQNIRSKKNSQTTVFGPPGEPIWNQDFNLLVANPRIQKLKVEVIDSLGFADFTIGAAEVDIGILKDTVPTDRVVVLEGGWGPFRKKSGEVLLRLTYKAYVEDEEDSTTAAVSTETYASDDELSDADESDAIYEEVRTEPLDGTTRETFMDDLAALLVSEEFLGIVSSATVGSKLSESVSGVKPSAPSKSLSASDNSPPSPSVSDNSLPSEPDKASEVPAGSALFWLAVITSSLVLIAITMSGSSLFNP